MTTYAPPSPASGAEAAERRDSARRPGRTAPLATHLRRHGHRIAHGALLLGTALLYLIGLSESGWANQYYAAAVQAGSQSWKAFLFGSLDASNFITVDKPPASLWVMDLSARVFGLNSWSLLVPQALEGVAAVALLYAAVKRVATPTAGLLAGAVLATTPVAALMFRFDNPDALLVLLMTAAGYATVRAVENARGRWLVAAGVLLGFAFLTKMLQGFLVVPAFAIAYLVAAPTTIRRRLLHLLAAGAAMFAAAGWWIALVELWPAGSRPYIGGSTNNNVLELVFGYNGIGRLTGSSNNGSVGGGTGGFSSGETGLTRLFGTDMGTQISWLLPAALIGVIALGWVTWKQPRVNRLRASAIVWGGWVVCTGLLLSYASGIIHPYYTVALAPGIAATVALSVSALWQLHADERRGEVARWLLAAVVAAGAFWTWELLARADWNSWLRWVVLLGGAGAVAVVLTRRVRIVVAAPLIALTLLIAPTAYSLQTASTAHTGALPTAGPSGTGGFGGRPGGTGGGFGGRPGGTGGGFGRFGGTAGTGGLPGAPGGSSTGSFPGAPTTGSAGGFPGGTAGRLGRGGGAMPGGLGGATSVSSALVTKLQQSSGYTWAAATVSANNASSLELASGTSVMSLGGFNGTDPAITLASFEKLVQQSKVHYFVADAQGFIGSTAADTSTAYRIQQWVEQHYTATTVGGSTVYDLSS